MQCPACGAEVVEQAVYCHKCGERLDSPRDTSPADTFAEGETPAAPIQQFEQAVQMRQNGANQAEEQLWSGGYSPKAMLGGWLISGLLSATFLTAGIFWARNIYWWLAVLVAILLPWLYFFSVLCYRRMNVRYSLSSQRFIHETGILRHVNNRIELLDMDDITFEQGPLERLTGVGTIRIASHDRTHPEMALPGIENVRQVAGIFDNARLVERRRRGLHIEQI